MHHKIIGLILLLFLLKGTFSYAQFNKQLLVQADGTTASDSRAYRSVAQLDADQDGDLDILGEVVTDPSFVPININFNSSSEDNAQGWNNLQQLPQINASQALINIQGKATEVALTLNTTWNGSGQKGYDDDRRDFYPRSVTRSYYFTNGTEEITITGLDPAQRYKFSFYGSTFGTNSMVNRSTIYHIGSQQVKLNASYNTTNIVTINNVKPGSGGVVTLKVAREAGADYAFLGAMVIALNRLQPQQYQLLENDGRSPFNAGIVVDEAANWSFGKTVDINEDSYPDIIAYDTEEQQLLWYENQTGASFIRKTVSRSGISYISKNQVFALDINQDDALDILVREDNQLYWYQQTDGAFAERALWTESGVSNTVETPVVRGDIDGDNLSDIIWQNSQQLYLLTSQSAYSLADSIQITEMVSPKALVVTDMNGDEKADLVITEGYHWTGSYRIGYLANREDGLANVPVYLNITDADWLNLRPDRLLADDVDQDGDLDLYVDLVPESCSEITPAQTGWLENKGGWQSAQYHPLSLDEVQWADIDQDGDQDLISQTNELTGINWVENAGNAWDSTAYQSITRTIIDKITDVAPKRNGEVLVGLTIQSTNYVADVALQQGNISPPRIQANLQAAGASFAQADINADGVAELFVADMNPEGFGVVRWQNSVSGSIQELVTHRGQPSTSRIFVSADGLLLAPVNQTGNQYGWWKISDGRFERLGTIAGRVTQLADLNGDGTVDILTDTGWYANTTNDQLTLLTTAKGSYATDMDGDGDTDVIEVPETGNSVWYVNQGNGNFTSRTLNLGSEKVLAFATLDSDSIADVIQSSASGLLWRAHTDGNGTFGPGTMIDDFIASQIKALDTDADGDTDLIAYNQTNVVQYKNMLQRQENNAPEVQQAIKDQITKSDTIYQFQVPDNAFKDTDTGDVLTFSAQLSNENSLPAWLTFAVSSRTFSGTPALSDTGTVTIQIQVADSEGATAIQDFNLSVLLGDSTKLGDGGEEPQNPITSVGDEVTSEFVLYPNPVERGQAIIITMPANHTFTEGNLYSAQGQRILKLKKGSLQIDSALLAPGVYLLELRSGQQIYRRRIIVQ